MDLAHADANLCCFRSIIILWPATSGQQQTLLAHAMRGRDEGLLARLRGGNDSSSLLLDVSLDVRVSGQQHTPFPSR